MSAKTADTRIFPTKPCIRKRHVIKMSITEVANTALILFAPVRTTTLFLSAG